jgi:DNA replication protein DnaC
MTQPEAKPLDLSALIALSPAGEIELAPERRISAPAEDVAKIDRDRRAKRLQDSRILRAINEEDANWLIEDSLPLKTHALQQVEWWQNIRGKGGVRSGMSVLGLLGLTGVGKTLSAGVLLGRLGGVYCLVEELVASFHASRGSDRTLFEEALDAHVLVIDELGFDKDPEKTTTMLSKVINLRQGRIGASGEWRRTWNLLLGNMTVEAFHGRYTETEERLQWRIAQSGMLVEVQGENLRLPFMDRIRKEQEKSSSAQQQLFAGEGA